ncbi:hypothetical protein WA026_015654 [Henosepilachna vigintioctopunctata]|uniref:Uncharacterized protein n=1 Tax=Henosepilachna vigintioctopunctata TaxID=420089 RepID=A0AAW1V7K4_9CUCU
MTPKLYMDEISSAVRSVLLTAKALNVTLDLKRVELNNEGQLSSKFMKLNPHHKVPTLVDNGYVIWDSHTIIAYLVGKYATDDSLYPRDIHKREVIDQRLHFDSEVNNDILKIIMNYVMYRDCENIPREVRDKMNQIYDLMETFLEEDWIAGNFISIADLILIPSITTMNVIHPIDFQKYPKIHCWIKRSEKQPFYIANQNGLNKLKCMLSCNGCLLCTA